MGWAFFIRISPSPDPPDVGAPHSTRDRIRLFIEHKLAGRGNVEVAQLARLCAARPVPVRVLITISK
jgi:hypothetical protein